MSYNQGMRVFGRIAVLVVYSVLVPFLALAGGGEGERARCFFESLDSPCDAGLSAQGNCEDELGRDACYCGKFLGVKVYSNKVCKSAGCGGENQRACCLLERVPSCDEGLVEQVFPTCQQVNPVGGCDCKVNPFGVATKSLGVCVPRKTFGQTGCLLDGFPAVDGAAPCADGFKCVPALPYQGNTQINPDPKSLGEVPVTMCVPDPVDPAAFLNSTPTTDLCASLYSPELLELAHALGVTNTYSIGAGAALVVGGSGEVGVAYSGKDRCFGCFTGHCVYGTVDAEIGANLCVGAVFDGFLPGNTAGFSCEGSSSISTPFDLIGLGATVIWPGDGEFGDVVACSSATPIGGSTCVSLGAGVNPSPVNASYARCNTIVNKVGCDADGDGVLDVAQQPPTCLTPEFSVCPGAGPISLGFESFAFAPSTDPINSYYWESNCPGATFSDASAADPTLTLTACSDCTISLSVGNGSGTTLCTGRVLGDTNPPGISCPADKTLECPANLSTANTGTATASDGCSGSPSISFVDSGSASAPGLVSRRWTAQDSCSNSSTCTQNITIVDTTAPTITTAAQSRTVESDGAGNTAELNAWLGSHGGAAATDGCSSALTWTNNFSGLSDGCGQTGVATVVFTATDPSGNSASTTASFTIVDTTDPSIDSQASNQTLECDGAGNTSALNSWLSSYGGAAASDNNGVTWSNDFAGISKSCGGTGNTKVAFTATDACGNSSSTSATFSIEDTSPPQIFSGAPASVSPDQFPVSYTATASDSCCADGLQVRIDDYDCYRFDSQGRRISNKESCGIELAGDTITIRNSIGVWSFVDWTVTVTDCCGVSRTELFTLDVLRP